MIRYSIIKADIKKNKKDIVPILKRNLEDITEEKYDWNYQKSTFGPAKCYIAKETKSDSFVGTAAIFPRKAFVKGKEKIAGIAGDYAVDKKHRAFGPALDIQKKVKSTANEGEFDFIYGLPNKQSKLLFLRIGYIEIGPLKDYIKILKTKHMAKEHLPHLLKFRIFSSIFDIYLRIVGKEYRYKKHKDFLIEEPDMFDKRFDIFFENMENSHNIVGKRSSDFLNWRYRKSPAQEYKIFCITDKEKDIKGYMVYFLKEKVCHIVDTFFKNSDKVVNVLFSEFLIHMNKKDIGAVAIKYLGNSFFKEQLKKYNFFERKAPNLSLFVFSKNISSEKILLNEENWYFFEGDSDI